MRRLAVRAWCVFVAAALGAVTAANATPPIVAGRTAGSFDVSQYGAATYTIPLNVPKGPASLQPSLALHYDSNIPDGLMGPGWALAGLSAITRCNSTYTQDGAAAAITLTSADHFCIDGQRLRGYSGTYGTDAAEYQTELADFSLIISHSSAGTGPGWFEVHRKDGLIYEYGNANTGTVADSQILAPGTPTAYVWALNKVRDRYGNHINYTYLSSNGSYVLTTIQYTALGSAGTAFQYEVSLAYNGRPATDPIVTYVAASQILQQNQLSTIKISSGGTVVRTYTLSYTGSTSTLRGTLTGINECSPTQCYSPTAVGYQYGTKGVASSFTNTAIVPASGGIVYSGDFNGDGTTDILYPVVSGTGYLWYVAFGNTNGTMSAAASTGLTTLTTDKVVVDDFLANGELSILTSTGGTWGLTYWSTASSRFVSTATTTTVDTSATSFTSADVDGDGLPDLVALYSTGSLYTRLNKSSGTTPSFGPATQSVASVYTTACPTGYAVSVRGNNSFPSSNVKRLDVNGDGRDDVVVTCHFKGDKGVPASNAYEIYLTTPTTFAAGPVLSNSGQLFDFVPLNYNNDACTDFAFQAALYISACNGAVASTIAAPTTVSSWVAAMDWDGDGRTDLVAVDTSSNIIVYLSNSSGTFLAPVSSGLTGVSSFRIVDLDGDGLDDLFAGISTGTFGYTLHLGAHARPDLAISFNDGFNVNYSPSYAAMSTHSCYTVDSAVTGSHITPRPLAVPVTCSHLASDGVGGTYTTTYQYYNSATDGAGRGWLGFQRKYTTDFRTGIVHTDIYAYAFPFLGMLQESLDRQTSDLKYIRDVSNTLSFATLSNTPIRVFRYVSQSVESDYEVQPGGALDGVLISQKTVTTSYNGGNGYTYGNPSAISTSIVDKDPNSPNLGATYTTALAITPYEVGGSAATGWCIHWPATISETRSTPAAPAGITHTTQYGVNQHNDCELDNQNVEPSNTTGDYVLNSYVYDTYGNPQSMTVTGQTPTGTVVGPRTTAWNYGTNGIAPISITQYLTSAQPQTTTIGYTFAPDLSKPTSVTDPNNIPVLSAIAYDDLGRLQQVQRADGTQTQWTYAACNGTCGANLLYVINQYEKDATASHTQFWYGQQYFDAFDRLVYDEAQQSNGVEAQRYYGRDSLGRVTQVSNPFGNGMSEYKTMIGYDILNRVTSVARPTSAAGAPGGTTQYGYSGRTATIQDANGYTTTRVSDALGQLISVTDPSPISGTTSYGYTPFGLLTTVGNSDTTTLSRNFDALGYWLTGTSDPDRGSWTIQMDSLGEVINVRDAKTGAPAWTQSYTYDGLGRPLTRTEPEGVTQWTWGSTASAHDIGQLDSIANSSGTESYTFDGIGRLATHRTQFGSSDHTVGYAYNTIGKLSTVTYPTTPGNANPFQAQYSYSNGYVSQVINYTAGVTGSVLWSLTPGVVNMDPWGHVVDETLGTTTPVRVRSGFDAASGELLTRQVGSGSTNANLQSLAYNWDPVGNLANRQDQNQVLTEAFNYDHLNRLSTSTLNGTANFGISFDSTGSIQSKTDSAIAIITPQAYTYDPVHVHAVSTVGSGSYQTHYKYDSNGNMSQRWTGTSTNPSPSSVTTLSWSSFNMLTGILIPQAVSTSIAYGPDRQRKYQVATYLGDGDEGTETTTYVGGIFEVETTPAQTHYKHFVAVPGGTRIIYDIESVSGQQTTYITGDHLGSGSLMINGAGTALLQQSYSAYGYRRSSNWGSVLSASSDYSTIASTTRRGYTSAFHESMDNVGLINMNGRVYDPAIGRFLSADPVAGVVGESQRSNPYSYASNRPLTNVDPSGLSDCAADDDSCTDQSGNTDNAGGAGNGGGGLEQIVVTSQRMDTVPGMVYWFQYIGFTDPVTGIAHVGFGPDGPVVDITATRLGVTDVGSYADSSIGDDSAVAPDQRPVDCNTVLPNGQTIGEFVRAAVQLTTSPVEMATDAVLSGPGSTGVAIGTVAPFGAGDFKNRFKGQASPTFLADAGNFAYGAYVSAVAGPSVSNFGAVMYARVANAVGSKPASFMAPNGMSKSGAANVPRGNANSGCPMPP